MNTDKQLADLEYKHDMSLHHLSYDVQYWMPRGWTLFKNYRDEEEAFWKAEVLAEGFIVRIIELRDDTERELWKSRI